MILNIVTTSFKFQAITDVELRHAARSIFATGLMNALRTRDTIVPPTEIVAS
jgi:hypothetical protein